MSSRSRAPVFRPAIVGYCLILTCMAVAVLCTATAQASYYRMVLCGANNGSNGFATATNTVSANNPGGIFNIENYCAAAPYPAGNNAFLRIVENQSSGNAGNTAYASASWTAPPHVAIAAGGGYTREPNQFNDGWRARFWAEGYDGSANNILMQGAGVANGSCNGVCWATTSTFASHLWPFSGYGHYRRFVFEMTCVRPAGCDRSGWNGVDANSMQLVLNDTTAPGIGFTGSGGIVGGQWVRGSQSVTWNVAEEGSGLRFERLRIDGGQQYVLDHRGSCNIDWHPATGEFARDFRPCPTGGFSGRSTALDTATIPDGSHVMQVCAQDYGQSVGLSGSGGESCDQRTIRVDNNAPGAPGGLVIETSNPARYSEHFGARWTLPPDPGSPIARVHYSIIDASGNVVVPEQTIAAAKPTSLDQIAGPKAAGDYRLRVWLEDGVGFTGPVATVPIPHDTTPPAAPQEVSVTNPETPRSDQGFDVRWQNITDAGAPIDAVHYAVLNRTGNVVVGTKDVAGENPQSIANLETPTGSGNYTLKLWLSDAEGNVGAPIEAPLSYECVRSDVGGGKTLSAGVGQGLAPLTVVRQGQGSTLGGSLRGPGGPVAGAAVCVFSRAVTDGARDYLGVAMTGGEGDYRFVLGRGPSREITSIYRADQREIEASATVRTRVKPTLKLGKKVVHNKHFATFSGYIPGPHNDNVVVVIQVKSGEGWRVFRRYRTRDGHYSVRYLLTQTFNPTTYPVRTQVRRTVGYPYEPGNSRVIPLRVLP